MSPKIASTILGWFFFGRLGLRRGWGLFCLPLGRVCCLFLFVGNDNISIPRLVKTAGVGVCLVQGHTFYNNPFTKEHCWGDVRQSIGRSHRPLNDLLCESKEMDSLGNQFTLNILLKCSILDVMHLHSVSIRRGPFRRRP